MHFKLPVSHNAQRFPLQRVVILQLHTHTFYFQSLCCTILLGLSITALSHRDALPHDDAQNKFEEESIS